MKKRGISAVVATVLIILITVAAVSIIWTAIIPMIKDNLDFSSLEGRVSVMTSAGYTFYDASTQKASVQVKREVDDGVMDRVRIVFSIGGNSVGSSVIAPDSGNTKVYVFDLSGEGEPESVSVAPILVVGEREKEGDITSEQKISKGTIDSGDGNFVYDIGRDYRERSCLDLRNMGNVDDGVYEIDPDGANYETEPFLVNCDMTRDGGGWTQILKTWYVSLTVSAGAFGETGDVGDVIDGLQHLGNGYKLSDDKVRAIIGSGQKFSILADQSGYNIGTSTGNYEYVILRDYTEYWRFDGPVLASSTTTTFQSYRASDGALAWTGNLQCGDGGAGINCKTVLDNSPNGGSGCDINMGSSSSPTWHHFFMSESNMDTYLYICNGAQYSSQNRFSHRFWVREG